MKDDGDPCEECGSKNTVIESDYNRTSYWYDLICKDCNHSEEVGGGSEE